MGMPSEENGGIKMRFLIRLAGIPKCPLWLVIFICTLAATDFGLHRAIRYARTINSSSWLHSKGSLQNPIADSSDPRQTLKTDAFLSNRELRDLYPCTSDPDNPGVIEESAVVATIRASKPSGTVQSLLKHHWYSSAYHLFKALSLHNADGEIGSLTSAIFQTTPTQADEDDPQEDTISLAHFATKWYLEPALWYVSHKREQDAITLYLLSLWKMFSNGRENTPVARMSKPYSARCSGT
jgi:hypothetical protein